MPYEVQTPVYDGPFDLLLHLILSQELDLYEVSLADVVDAYLVELDRLEGLDLDVATEFLLIAATLVELKARRLLPGDDDVDLDDELALWEERDLLLARLLEAKTFSDAAGALASLAAVASRSRPRRTGLEERFAEVAPDLLAGVGPLDLRAAYLRAVAPKPVPRVELDHVAPIGISVTDAVAELTDELPRVGRIGFRALTGDLVERLEVVVRFLAVLELCKQGLVDLDQAGTFADIEVTWLGDTADALDGAGTPDRRRFDLAAVDAYDG